MCFNAPQHGSNNRFDNQIWDVCPLMFVCCACALCAPHCDDDDGATVLTTRALNANNKKKNGNKQVHVTLDHG